MSGDVHIETADGLTTIIVDRPETMNAVTHPMHGAMMHLLRDDAHDTTIGAVFIWGKEPDICACDDIVVPAEAGRGTFDLSASSTSFFRNALGCFPKSLGIARLAPVGAVRSTAHAPARGRSPEPMAS